MFSTPDIEKGRYGEPSSKVYDDVKDIDEIQSVITGNPKRVVDNLVLKQDPSKIKTALRVAQLVGNIWNLADSPDVEHHSQPSLDYSAMVTSLNNNQNTSGNDDDLRISEHEV